MEPTDHSLEVPAVGLVRRLPPPPRVLRRRYWLLGRVPVYVQLLCAAAVVALLVAVWQVGSYWIITRFGAAVAGEVTGKSPAGTPGPKAHRIEFRYRINGQEYSSEDRLDEGAFEILHVGMRVQVRVLAACPERPYLVEPRGHAGRGSGVLLWFALLGNGAAGALLWRSLRGPRRQRALVHAGVATSGVIVGKEASVGRRLTWGVQFSYRAPRHGVGPDMYEAAIAEKEWQVRMIVRRADYEAAQVGAAVTVLYDPLQPAHSLIYAFADYEAAEPFPEAPAG